MARAVTLRPGPGPLLVEFVGLPGSGKTTLALRTDAWLRAAGVPTAAHLRAAPRSPWRRWTAPLADAAGLARRRPGLLGRCLAATWGACPSRPSLWATLSLNLTRATALLERARRVQAVHLVDQGTLQLLWSLAHRCGPEPLPTVRARLGEGFPRPDVVVLVTARPELVQERLRARGRRRGAPGGPLAGSSPSQAALARAARALAAVRDGIGPGPLVLEFRNDAEEDLAAAVAALGARLRDELARTDRPSEPRAERRETPRRPAGSSPGRRLLKRVLDVELATLGLLLLGPLLLAIAARLWLRRDGPVLFHQLRPGLHERPFRILKFRTMTDATDDRGDLLPNERRLFPLGRLLRSTSLDELPELLNVLRGDMSLVGPRPLLMAYLDHYTPQERRRHDVRPGVTGLAQVSGRNGLTWDEKMALDVAYVRRHSLWLDARILGRTALAVLRPRPGEVRSDGGEAVPRTLAAPVMKFGGERP